MAVSALISKILGLLRNNLFLNIFPEEKDIIFAAFRIPDFFYYLFVGATISIIFIPRAQNLNKEDLKKFFSSFFWSVFVLFGGIMLLGIIFSSFLVKIFAGGFDIALQKKAIQLSWFLFCSVFILSLSSVFAAFLQKKHKFLSLALAPIFYTGGICVGLFFLQNSFGLFTVGLSAVFGACLHLIINTISFFLHHGQIGFFWKKPKKLWSNFAGDFWRRVSNNAMFQINQSADVLIASFLIAGSVTAFSLGSELGHILMSIVGLSVANAAFPKFANKNNCKKSQNKILKKSVFWILFFTLPAAIFGGIFSEKIIQFLYPTLDGKNLFMTVSVFFWTVISLPMGCLCPVFSRIFLANNDTKTPLKITTFTLGFSTILAAILSLKIFSAEKAILGLALGNFCANTLNALFFFFVLKYKFFGNKK